VTSYTVPPGGIVDNDSFPDPPVDYGTTSPVCPRDGGDALGYDYWPGVEIIPCVDTPRRIKRFRTATRVISRNEGTIDDCDTISGLVTGPFDAPGCGSAANPCDQMQNDARFAGCVRCSGCDGNAVFPLDCSEDEEGDCSNAVANWFDDQPQNQRVTGATFKMMRVANDAITCDQVRALTF
jgi:hypothetical protein